MKIEDREALAQKGDMSVQAHCARLVAARKAIGLSQAEFAAEVGVKPNAMNNMERGRQRPNYAVMRYLHREHRIDFNFMINGDFVQLPGDVQTALFSALEGCEADQTPS